MTPALALTTAGVLALPALAVADDIVNNLDASVDITAEVMPLNVGGADGTTQLYVSPANGDGKNGCNLTGGTTLGLAVSSSNTAVATVSPSSVTFTSCSDTKTLTVTPVAQGSATISATQTSNTTGGSFNLAPAVFTVNVAPPANTAPSVSVTGVAGGADYDKGSVPAATCQVTDAEDGSSSFPATLSTVTGDYASDGIGSQTASCSYQDRGGLTASASETYSIVDPSAPVIGKTVTGTLGDNGWYTSDVSLEWQVSEPQSPISLLKTGCEDQLISADQAATSYTCSASSAGGAATEQTVTIKRDATAPSVSAGDPTGTLGSNGWYTSDVTVPFTASDATSGVAGAATVPVTTTGEASDVQVSSPAFNDIAGNTTGAGEVVRSFKVDKTKPAVPTFSGGGDVYFGDTPQAPTCSSSDGGSGLEDCVVTAGTGNSWVATATDNAGNTSTATQGYNVLSWTVKGFYSPVDMSGTLNTAKGGSSIPLKFELFKGSRELTDAADIASFRTASVTCTSGTALTDEIEIVNTGGTSLRYDSTAGQFIQNWKTPTAAGCYKATMTAKDGSSISALFQLRK